MSHLIEYLKAKGVDGLQSELAIKATRHDSLPLAIFNYCQINSPKRHPVVRECRGLVVDLDRHEIVARGFPRFFNLGEVPEEDAAFDWSSAETTTKEDGSLVLLYWYRGEWRINTRGSFGGGEVTGTGKTWGELIRATLRADGLGSINPLITYCLEFCSPWTQVVRLYPKAHCVMLAGFETETGLEADPEHVERMAGYLGVRMVDRHSLRSPSEVRDFIEKTAERDASWEGLVVRDGQGRRVKVKSARYVALHHMSGNGAIFHPRRLLPFVLRGEQSEVLTHFPAAASSIEKVEAWLKGVFESVSDAWFMHKGIESQKEFALAVKDRPFSWSLFEARKYKSDPVEVLRKSENKLIEKFMDEHPEWAASDPVEEVAA